MFSSCEDPGTRGGVARSAGEERRHATLRLSLSPLRGGTEIANLARKSYPATEGSRMGNKSASNHTGSRKVDRNRKSGVAPAEGGAEGVRTLEPPSPELEAVSKSSRRTASRQAGVQGRPVGPGRTGRTPSHIVSMSSTEAQNGFGNLLETVARDGTVFITRRKAAKAVVLSVERYEELTREAEPALDELTAEFDALLNRMQSPQARAGIRAAFSAAPDELAAAAVAAARDDRR